MQVFSVTNLITTALSVYPSRLSLNEFRTILVGYNM